MPLASKLPLLLLASFLLAAIAFGIAGRLGPLPQVHFSYLVSLSEREVTPDFEFDGYYALQATDLFAATLAEWLTTPEVVVAAYREAGLEPDTDDPRALTRLVEARKTAPQLVEVTVKGSSQAEAEALTAGLLVAMERNVALYHDEGIPAVEFGVVATEPFSGQRTINARLIAVATFFTALILLINAALLFGAQANEPRGRVVP